MSIEGGLFCDENDNEKQVEWSSPRRSAADPNAFIRYGRKPDNLRSMLVEVTRSDGRITHGSVGGVPVDENGKVVKTDGSVTEMSWPEDVPDTEQ